MSILCEIAIWICFGVIGYAARAIQNENAAAKGILSVSGRLYTLSPMPHNGDDHECPRCGRDAHAVAKCGRPGCNTP